MPANLPMVWKTNLTSFVALKSMGAVERGVSCGGPGRSTGSGGAGGASAGGRRRPICPPSSASFDGLFEWQAHSKGQSRRLLEFGDRQLQIALLEVLLALLEVILPVQRAQPDGLEPVEGVRGILLDRAVEMDRALVIVLQQLGLIARASSAAAICLWTAR